MKKVIYEAIEDQIDIKELEIQIKELELEALEALPEEQESIKQQIEDLRAQIESIKDSITEARHLLKVRLIYQGSNMWSLKPQQYMNGGLPTKEKEIIIRGDEEKVRKMLIALQAKDTETDPATVRNDSYKNMVQKAKDNRSNMLWIWSNVWQNSNKIV